LLSPIPDAFPERLRVPIIAAIGRCATPRGVDA
jgi:hypothetical protein